MYIGSSLLTLVPVHFKTEKMCIKAAEKEAETLEYVPDHFKSWEMCIEAVKKETETL